MNTQERLEAAAARVIGEWEEQYGDYDDRTERVIDGFGLDMDQVITFFWDWVAETTERRVASFGGESSEEAARDSVMAIMYRVAFAMGLDIGRSLAEFTVIDDGGAWSIGPPTETT